MARRRGKNKAAARVLQELIDFQDQQGISNYDLARLAGTGPNVLTRIRQGYDTRLINALIPLADVLGYEVTLVKKSAIRRKKLP